MLIKIFLVAILIVLSWNTIKVSESNALLQAQLIELKNHSEELTKSVLSNNKLLVQQGKAIDKNSNLSGLNKSLLLKTTKIEGTLASLSKQSNSKKSFEQINNTLKKQSKTLSENKKTIDGLVSLKKPVYQIIEMLKKQSTSIVKHSNSISALKLCKTVVETVKKPAYKKKSVTKPKAPTSLNGVYVKFYDTKEQYHNKNYKGAIERLAKLKSEVWRIRDLDIVSKDKAMTILSAIDVTKKKWENKEKDYDLSNIANKINILAPDTNTIGACK